MLVSANRVGYSAGRYERHCEVFSEAFSLQML